MQTKMPSQDSWPDNSWFPDRWMSVLIFPGQRENGRLMVRRNCELSELSR